MVDIARDYGTAAGNLIANEFRRNEFRDFRAEAFALLDLGFSILDRFLATQILTLCDIDHLFGDDAGFRIFELRQRAISSAAQRLVRDREFAREIFAGGTAIVFWLHFASVISLNVSALEHPICAVAREAFLDIDRDTRIRVRTRRVIDWYWRLIRARVQVDHPARDRQARIRLGVGVDLTARWQRPSGDFRGLELRLVDGFVHGAVFLQ